jgi:hypothetical protein
MGLFTKLFYIQAHFDPPTPRLRRAGGRLLLSKVEVSMRTEDVVFSARPELVEGYLRAQIKIGTCASYRGDSSASERYGSHPHQLMGTRPITRRNPRELLVHECRGVAKPLCEKKLAFFMPVWVPNGLSWGLYFILKKNRSKISFDRLRTSGMMTFGARKNKYYCTILLLFL